MKLWTWVLAALMLLAGFNAEAARLGGGRSFGKQSSNVTQRQAAPMPPAAAPAAAPAGVAPKRPWGAMLGGLAAGLGLAWLANSLGMGGAFGQILMFALLAMVIMMAVAWFKRSRSGAQSQDTAKSPFAFQGAAPATAAQLPASYRPENVGNDASARPWERNSTAFEALKTTPAVAGSMIGSGLAGSQSWGVPDGFDAEGFLTSAKANFVSLQAAWDKSDINALRVMMTDTMLKEIQAQLAEREAHTGGPVNLTDVVMIEAQLLGIEDTGDDYMASVEFSGMIREEPSAGASPFREVWNMTKTKSGKSGWLVAGVQALQ
ncbi:import inner membrane translocase, subunit Tim44 [Rhodoferax ferrireducens T118]|uniref:Import inner membrane translocase, subunit Tim44 n=1 Tax=Albidiferax ferrireducens (strain ATCC BAA-621 / DSM 15236 / T118) TaxID=338969 RepID=Q21YX7_ALBFT|nr:Tim44-like domain-containing protein [Rhodoferax ferrireducens]ABD69026.1 import inner membrane translocase, subunit Tim44 [Rhodoferax ferrireducens T118]WPC68155.1 Tim44-like domain-containing protein [Rhodoferax ferrireducens]